MKKVGAVLVEVDVHHPTKKAWGLCHLRGSNPTKGMFQVGRIAVRKSMKRLCECHGISGSCSIEVIFVSAEFPVIS